MLGFILFSLIIGAVIYFIAVKIQSKKWRNIFFAANYFLALAIIILGFALGIHITFYAESPFETFMSAALINLFVSMFGFLHALIVSCVIIARFIVEKHRKNQEN